jgi:hypothetical protein
LGALLGEPMKHNWKMDYIYEGKLYKSINGIVELPVEVKSINPIKEDVEEQKTTSNEKLDLVKKAHELGLGSPSQLERNSIETLKKKIEEA